MAGTRAGIGRITHLFVRLQSLPGTAGALLGWTLISISANQTQIATLQKHMEQIEKRLTRVEIYLDVVAEQRQGPCSKEYRASLKIAPLDFIARLAALVPKPRVNLTRLRRDLHRRVRSTFLPFEFVVARSTFGSSR